MLVGEKVGEKMPEHSCSFPFCIKSPGVLYRNGFRFVLKRLAFCIESVPHFVSKRLTVLYRNARWNTPAYSVCQQYFPAFSLPFQK